MAIGRGRAEIGSLDSSIFARGFLGGVSGAPAHWERSRYLGRSLGWWVSTAVGIDKRRGVRPALGVVGEQSVRIVATERAMSRSNSPAENCERMRWLAAEMEKLRPFPKVKAQVYRFRSWEEHLDFTISRAARRV